MIQETAQPDAMLNWMSCLADATRVRLLRLLEQQELGVSDLCEVVQMPQSTVSRHLKVLADEGWVGHRRQGTTNLYRVILDELTPAQQDLWQLTRSQMAEWATLRQDAVRLASRAGRSKAFFAGLAEQWDRTRESVYGSGLNAHALAGLLPADATVVDFGCGTGNLLATLAPQVKNAIGIDASPEMLTAAKARTRSLENVALHEDDLAQTPLAANTADASLCVLVLSYLETPADVVAEMARVTKPGCPVVVADLLRHDRDAFRREMGQQTNGFTADGLAGLLIDAGLKRVTTNPLPPDPDATGPALLLARGLAK